MCAEKKFKHPTSNQKLKDLGWKIKMDFDVGIKDLILHYKNKINSLAFFKTIYHDDVLV